MALQSTLGSISHIYMNFSLSLTDLYRLATEAHAYARLASDGIQNLNREVHTDEVKALYHSLVDVHATQTALLERAQAIKEEGPEYFTESDWRGMLFACEESPPVIQETAKMMNALAKRYPSLKLAPV